MSHKRFLSLSFTAAIMLAANIVCAQDVPPPPPSTPGVPGLQVPIDGNLWVLVFVGICLLAWKGKYLMRLRK